MSIFERYEICTLSKRQLNKLSDDTKLIIIELLLLQNEEKYGLFFLLFSLYFTRYFAQFLKISLTDISHITMMV